MNDRAHLANSLRGLDLGMPREPVVDGVEERPAVHTAARCGPLPVMVLWTPETPHWAGAAIGHGRTTWLLGGGGHGIRSATKSDTRRHGLVAVLAPVGCL